MEHVERTTSLEPVEEQELVDPDLMTESRDWSSELIDAIKDLGIAFDGLNIHTIDPGQSTPLTRELINAEYASEDHPDPDRLRNHYHPSTQVVPSTPAPSNYSRPVENNVPVTLSQVPGRWTPTSTYGPTGTLLEEYI
ncbi:hypothetical protein OS493_002533 [Desmophyllum pertusum]|uniref:Uncharacterized protein n=1 Tax=Desmophyllum pertusum TaxID=174260 RepID=A0A9W9YT68_9CNID|nr:hypothetical protein OS493_002533 [Desmophyllum pertusum]